MKIDAELFWKRVEAQWERTGLSKVEFCAQTGGKINYGTWANKKSQGKVPNLELASDFAEALHVSLDFLVSGEDHLDPVYKKLDQNPRLKRLASSMTKCQDLHLSIIETLFFSWGCTEINEPILLQKRVVSS